MGKSDYDDDEEEEGKRRDDDDDSLPKPEVPDWDKDDAWLMEAVRLQRSIEDMVIRLKKEENMLADSSSVVATFAAGTTNRIEALRQAVEEESTSSAVAAHRSGIVAHLLQRLSSDIANPLSQRHKQSFVPRLMADITDRPFSLRHAQEMLGAQESAHGVSSPPPRSYQDKSMSAAARGENQQREVKEEADFLRIFGDDSWTAAAAAAADPRSKKTPSEPLSFNAWKDEVFSRSVALDGAGGEGGGNGAGGAAIAATMPPQEETRHRVEAKEENVNRESNATSMLRWRRGSKSPSQTAMSDATRRYPQIAQQAPWEQESHDAAHEEYLEELARESAKLTAQRQSSKVDDVRRMEKTMMSITSLISQFSNLVAEQQQDIMEISQATQSSKKNMTSGQDSLVDARERKKKSGHLSASIIVGSALVLLFFHWVTP